MISPDPEPNSRAFVTFMRKKGNPSKENGYLKRSRHHGQINECSGKTGQVRKTPSFLGVIVDRLSYEDKATILEENEN